MSNPIPPSTRSPKKPKIVVWILLAAAVVAAIIGYAVAQGNSKAASPQAADAATTEQQVVRENSRVLSQAPSEKAVLVEFLDFECEACLAAYPLVEQIREEYAGELTFVVRYFPIPSHANAVNAAVAVEAAAQQGKIEEMYTRMYETQTEWGEQQTSKADVFRGFAQEMGLDMEAYDSAVADPATLERVEQDRQDGLALGVQGTPTFFLDGELLQPASTEDFRAQVDAAVND